MNYLIVTLLLFGLLTGCSPSSDEGQKKPVATTAKTTPVVPSGSWIAPAREVILDSFEVGADAYVRALMVEKEDNTLWVGTSVGVLEIGLDKLDVRNTLTRAQGLANEYVFAIGRDREGYKWFGTNAGGASRYKDGTWKTYFPMHGLADYWVYSFAQHPDGGLWIGTWAGVNRMDLVTGRFDTFVKELVNEWVYAIVVDSRNRTWFGTEGGISRLDGHEWRSWTHKDGLGGENLEESPVSSNTGLGTRRRHDLGVLSGGDSTYNPNYVFSLAMESADVVWAGTWGGGVSRFDGKTWTSYSRNEGLPGNVVYSLVIDPRGRIWAGTDNGIGVFDKGSWNYFPQGNPLAGQHFYALAVTPSGEIWAGTKGKVLRIGTSSQKKE